jgi:hypothetical protein
MKLLRTHPEAYNEIVKTHFVRHLRAFAKWSS